jgi:hypothetical protein
MRRADWPMMYSVRTAGPIARQLAPLLAAIAVGFWVGLQPLSAAVPNPTTTKHESFDDDPKWDGRNNRMVLKDPPIVIQDFGYSPTHHAGVNPAKSAANCGNRSAQVIMARSSAGDRWRTA